MQAKIRSDSRQEEECRHHERRNNYKRTSHSRSDKRIHRHHSTPYSTRKFYAYEESTRNPEVSDVRHQWRRHELESLEG